MNETAQRHSESRMAPVEEVVVVPERETLSRVMTAPCRLGVVIAPLTIATRNMLQHREGNAVPTSD